MLKAITTLEKWLCYIWTQPSNIIYSREIKGKSSFLAPVGRAWADLWITKVPAPACKNVFIFFIFIYFIVLFKSQLSLISISKVINCNLCMFKVCTLTTSRKSHVFFSIIWTWTLHRHLYCTNAMNNHFCWNFIVPLAKTTLWSSVHLPLFGAIGN